MRVSKKFLLTIFLVAIILAGVFWSLAYWSRYQRKNLEVVFLDVGQGDAVLLKSPDGQNVLVDGGEDGRVMRNLEKYLPWWDRRLDLIILTHPHRDHAGGLAEVAKRWRVDHIIQSGAQSDYPEYLELLRTSQEKKILISNFGAGQKILFGRLNLLALHPSPSVAGVSLSDEATNEASLVFLASYGEKRFLLTGDIGELTEKELLAVKGDLSAEVLKIAHHGSENSSSQKFLEAVSPHWAVVEVGRNNSFGHPSRRILHRLERLKTLIFRTDLDGDIRFFSDGQSVWADR